MVAQIDDDGTPLRRIDGGMVTSPAEPGQDDEVLTTDRDQVRKFFDVLVYPGAVHEIRIPKPKRGGGLFGTTSGFFDNARAAAQALLPIDGEVAEGVYITLNPVNPDLFARREPA